MSRSSLVALLGLLALTGCGSSEKPPPRAASPGESLEVMTYNVNFGLEGDPAAIAAIRAEDADLVLLQETTPGWEQSLRAELGAQYPHIDCHHWRGAGGHAVLSKHPIRKQELIAPPEGGWFPALLLEVDSPLGRVQVLAVHLRPQLSESGSFASGYFTTPGVRFAEMSRYYAYLEPSLPTLVVGDFNEGRRGLAIGYLERRGFKSGLAEFQSEPTWRWPTSIGNVSAELDHIAYRAPFQPLGVRVLSAGRSDHLPVVGVFALNRD